MTRNGKKMNNVKKLCEKAKNIKEFSKNYFKRLNNIFDNLDYQPKNEIDNLSQLLDIV